MNVIQNFIGMILLTIVCFLGTAVHTIAIVNKLSHNKRDIRNILRNLMRNKSLTKSFAWNGSQVIRIQLLQLICGLPK